MGTMCLCLCAHGYQCVCVCVRVWVLVNFMKLRDLKILSALKMLGRAFGIPENSVKTYTEAEIRAGYITLFYH